MYQLVRAERHENTVQAGGLEMKDADILQLC
jgi:hypothetical protein